MNVAITRLRQDQSDILRELKLSSLKSDAGVFAHDLAHTLQKPDDFWRIQAERLAKSTDAAAFLANVDNVPRGIAFCSLTSNCSTLECQISGIWVAPSHRRKKLSAKLLEHAIEWAAKANSPHATLWVTEDNLPARRAYESLGFRETRETKPFPRDPSRIGLKYSLRVPPRYTQIDAFD